MVKASALQGEAGRPRLHFLVPGDLNVRTGGYGYDRRVAHGLQQLGWQVCHHALDASFPAPTRAALATAASRLDQIGDDEIVLIDGLALGVMAEIVHRHRDRVRLVGLVHHLLADESGISPAQVSALRAGEVRALAAMRAIVVTSPATGQRLAAAGVAADRITVIEPGTDRALLAIRAGRPPLQLLSVGAVIPRKGHTILIDALAAIQQESWHLHLVGSLEREPKTAAQVVDQISRLGLSERVTLTGELDDEDLDHAYRTADLFVLASLFEGYGMAFAEALARGLPVVGSGDGAVRDTVPADAGMLVEPGSSAALADALRLVLRDPARLHALAAGAERTRTRLPDWPSRYRRWSETLKNV